MHEDRGENDCVQRAKGEALYLPMCVHAVPVCMFQRANTPLSVRKIDDGIGYRITAGSLPTDVTPSR